MVLMKARRILRGRTQTDNLDLSTATEYGYKFVTGKPVTFRYTRNIESAPNLGAKYQQDVEPAGRYLLVDNDPGHTLPEWEKGTASFRSPLVLTLNSGTEGIYDEKGWKARLHQHYGEKGERLTQAIIRDGYDAIVTTFRGYTREIVALKPNTQLEIGGENMDLKEASHVLRQSANPEGPFVPIISRRKPCQD